MRKVWEDKRGLDGPVAEGTEQSLVILARAAFVGSIDLHITSNEYLRRNYENVFDVNPIVKRKCWFDDVIGRGQVQAPLQCTIYQ